MPANASRCRAHVHPYGVRSVHRVGCRTVSTWMHVRVSTDAANAHHEGSQGSTLTAGQYGFSTGQARRHQTCAPDGGSGRTARRSAVGLSYTPSGVHGSRWALRDGCGRRAARDRAGRRRGETPPPAQRMSTSKANADAQADAGSGAGSPRCVDDRVASRSVGQPGRHGMPEEELRAAVQGNRVALEKGLRTAAGFRPGASRRKTQWLCRTSRRIRRRRAPQSARGWTRGRDSCPLPAPGRATNHRWHTTSIWRAWWTASLALLALIAIRKHTPRSPDDT